MKRTDLIPLVSFLSRRPGPMLGVLLLLFTVAAARAQDAAATPAVAPEPPPQTVERAAAALSVSDAERLLSELGYWTGKVDGRLDPATRHAIMAFQKVEGLKRTGVLTPAVLERLRSASAPTPKFSGGPHIEVDISRQVLFVVDAGGRVSLIVPVSTGNGKRYFDKSKNAWDVAVTPRGEFRIERKFNGTREAPLGSLYFPSYFKEGWAVHGSASIPPRPASHGCVRVPRGADQKLFKLMPVGMKIYLYD
ncbi:MAG: L,D-transpeptidase family protein [Pyrinomonadaceae bacterium]